MDAAEERDGVGKMYKTRRCNHAAAERSESGRLGKQGDTRMKTGVSQQRKLMRMVNPRAARWLAVVLLAGLVGLALTAPYQWVQRRNYPSRSVLAVEVGLLGWDGGVFSRFAAEGCSVRIAPWRGWITLALTAIIAPLVGVSWFQRAPRWRARLLRFGVWLWLSVWIIGVAAAVLERMHWWAPLMLHPQPRLIHLGYPLCRWRPIPAVVLVFGALLISAWWVRSRLQRQQVSVVRGLLILRSLWPWFLPVLVLSAKLLDHSSRFLHLLNDVVNYDWLINPQSGWYTFQIASALLTCWLMIATVGLLLMLPGRLHQWMKLTRLGTRCQHCGYDLRGTLEARRVECPECGGAVPVNLRTVMHARAVTDGGEMR